MISFEPRPRPSQVFVLISPRDRDRALGSFLLPFARRHGA